MLQQGSSDPGAQRILCRRRRSVGVIVRVRVFMSMRHSQSNVDDAEQYKHERLNDRYHEPEHHKGQGDEYWYQSEKA